MLPTDLPDKMKKNVPDILLKYQSGLISKITETAMQTVLFCEKSRRIGVTWALAAHAVLTAMADKRSGGMNVFYMGYNLEMAREFIKVCADWAKMFDLACEEIEECVWTEKTEDGKDKNIKAFRIRFSSGYEIIVLPSSARSLRGMQGLVILDEAAFHDELNEVLKAAYALLMWGGKVIVVSTHDGVDNPFNQNIQAIREKRKGFTRHKVVRITFQDAIDDGLYERICLVKGDTPTTEGKAEFVASMYDAYGEGAGEELDVVPRKSGGVYFPSALIEPCMNDAPVIRYEQKDEFFKLPAYEKERIIQDWCAEFLKPHLDALDPKLMHNFGFDFARNGDLSIYAPMFREQNTRRRIPFHVELRNIPFTQQEQILFYMTDRLPRLSPSMMDGTGNGAQIAEKMQERYGEHIILSVKINVSWYEESLPPYKAAYEDSNIIVPKDMDTLQDHRTAQVIGGVPQIPRLKGSDNKPRHGDTLVAYAGAYWATMQETRDYGYTSVYGGEPSNHPLRDRDNRNDAPQKSRVFGNSRGAW